MAPISEATAEIFNDRIDDVAEAAVAVFNELLGETPAEDVLGFALISDLDASQLQAALYRREDRDALLATYADPAYGRGMDWDLLLQWTPAQWPHSTTRVQVDTVAELYRVWDEVLSLRSRVEADDPEYWPAIPWETGALAMATLHQEQVLAEFPNAVHKFAVPGLGLDDGRRVRWVTLMNDESRVEQFRASLAELARQTPSF